MKSERKSLRLFACLAIPILIAACSGQPTPTSSAPPPRADPVAEGERLLRSMSDTLAKSNSFTFETNEQLEITGTAGEKGVVHFTRKATVKRPNALFFELRGTDEVPLEIDAHYDGRTVSLNNRVNGRWAQTEVPATLDEMLDDVAKRFGLPVPFGDVVYSSPYDAFIGPDTRGGVVGEETIDGMKYAKLDYADEYVQVKLWLPTSGPTLPRRLEMIYKKTPTPMTAQLNFTSWKLDTPVDDSMFAFKPASSNDQADFGDFTAGLLARVVPPAQQPASTPETKSK